MRLIDGDDVFKTLSEEAAHRIRHSDGGRFDVGRSNGIITARDIIRNMPTIEPVKRGKWKQHLLPDLDWIKYAQECSECHEFVNGVYQTDFCPNCGAKMGGDSD